PLDHARPAITSHRGGVYAGMLAPELTSRLQALARERGVTLYMLMLAAFQALLHRMSRQDVILIGPPVDGPNHGAVEGLIRLLINTLVMRADFSAGLPFGELLAQVRETSIAAYEHQDLPFEQLVAELNPVRSRSHAPVFQVLFQFERGG